MRFTRREFLLWTGTAGLSGRIWGAASRAAAEAFSIAALNDLHITKASDAALVRQAVAQINDMPSLRCTVVLGDITHDCNPDQYIWAKEALDGLARPYRAVPGNHDVVGRRGLAYADYMRLFGERQWMWRVGDWHFIGLDSCERSAREVQIPVARIAWLNEQLRRIPPDHPIALFSHHPFNPNIPMFRVRNAEKVLALFGKHRLRLVASGHWHGNQVETQNGILFTTTACCSSARANHDFTPSKGFRLFHLDGDSVTTEFVPVTR